MLDDAYLGDLNSEYQSSKEDWHGGKRYNKGAMHARALRERKHQKSRKSELISELAVYDRESANAAKLSIGIYGGTEAFGYSILFDGSFITATPSSKQERSLLKQMVVGDNVVFGLVDGKPQVKGILARVSRLARLRTEGGRTSLLGAEEHIMAANVDVAVIVVSSTQPPFHPRLVDRYLVLCEYGNVKPVICMTKIDLEKAPDLSMYTEMNIPVFEVSNATGKGLDRLLAGLEGKLCVLVGHSGVGKSTIINALLKNEDLPTAAVGRKSGRGRHTTTNSSLHPIGKSTLLIDTPGIRSLGLFDITPDNLRFYFPEFDEFSSKCQYRDCTHSHEPKCGVKEAVKEKRISLRRYESYIRLLSESK